MQRYAVIPYTDQASLNLCSCLKCYICCHFCACVFAIVKTEEKTNGNLLWSLYELSALTMGVNSSRRLREIKQDSKREKLLRKLVQLPTSCTVLSRLGAVGGSLLCLLPSLEYIYKFRVAFLAMRFLGWWRRESKFSLWGFFWLKAEPMPQLSFPTYCLSCPGLIAHSQFLMAGSPHQCNSFR